MLNVFVHLFTDTARLSFVDAKKEWQNNPLFSEASIYIMSTLISIIVCFMVKLQLLVFAVCEVCTYRWPVCGLYIAVRSAHKWAAKVSVEWIDLCLYTEVNARNHWLLWVQCLLFIFLSVLTRLSSSLSVVQCIVHTTLSTFSIRRPYCN